MGVGYSPPSTMQISDIRPKTKNLFQKIQYDFKSLRKSSKLSPFPLQRAGTGGNPVRKDKLNGLTRGFLKLFE